MSNVYIIAEAGVNHNGSTEKALHLVDVAVESGADAIKFQTFKAANIVTKDAGKAEYQKHTTSGTETQFEMLQKLELSYEFHYELVDYCNKKNIDFLSTAFDLDSLGFLSSGLKLKKLKIPSGEITNGPLLLAYAKTGAELVLSTGMATLGEVEEALSILAFGFINDDSVKPSKTLFRQAYFSLDGQQSLKDKVTILHCTTEYPAPYDEINLNAIKTIEAAFGLKVGYSDHSEGIAVTTAAVAIGATVIEKHFTLNRELPGPDHKASLEPEELKTMIEAVRTVEQSMGDGIKVPAPSEVKNRSIARKSLVAAKDINRGEKFSEDNIEVKRPGIGVSPMKYWDIIGDRSKYNLKMDDMI